MIYTKEEYQSQKLPSARSMIKIQNSVLRKMPVVHLMPNEKVVNDDNTYFLKRLANGDYCVKPNITRQGMLFHGVSDYKENNELQFVLPYYLNSDKTGRANSEETKGYNARILSFAELIKSFPLYDLLSSGKLIVDGKIIRIANAIGIASAYNLRTPYLNLTSDLDEAMFYATHKYNQETQEFELVTEGEGIIYSFGLYSQFGSIPGLETLGKNVFGRLLDSKQFLLRIGEKESLDTNKYLFGLTFEHSKDDESLFDSQELEDKLIPSNDFLYKKWEILSKTKIEDLIKRYSRYNLDSFSSIKDVVYKEELKFNDKANSFTEQDLYDIDLYALWDKLCEKLVCNLDNDLVDKLKKVPMMDEYKGYFNVNLYFNERR